MGGVSLLAAVALIIVSTRRLQAMPVVAQRLGQGELGAIVANPGGGLPGQLETVINAISAKLTETSNATRRTRA